MSMVVASLTLDAASRRPSQATLPVGRQAEVGATDTTAIAIHLDCRLAER
jgi:hypothetical protein